MTNPSSTGDAATMAYTPPPPQATNGHPSIESTRPTPTGTGAHGAAALRTKTPANATVYGPDVVPDGTLNPRSCVICRKRKVKCDHLQPCTNCRRARVNCVFPSPGRAPRRPRAREATGSGGPAKNPATSEREVELMKRLRKLEGIVEELSGQIELETARQGNGSLGGQSPEATHDSPNSGEARSTGRGSLSSTPGAQTLDYTHDSPSSSTTDINKKFGRLVLHDKGKSRYVSSGFWSRINDDINELRAETEEMLESASEASDLGDSPLDFQISNVFPNSSYLFGYRCSDVGLRKYHPLPPQIMFIWKVFSDNVIPVCKLLHVPSMTAALVKAKDDLENVDPSLEALMFAMYLGAITSMEDPDVEMNFGATREDLLQQYRFALEMALAKAEFLISTDLTTLQALVLFVMLIRRRQDTRLAWTMTGLAVRISHSIGLHRDPSNFPNLSPFEGEMRRRLFWYLALLDVRAAEDQGTDVAINDMDSDTRRPLNINDDDFGPESKELPPEREGETEMAFVHMSFEIQPFARRILLLSSAAAVMCPRTVDSLAERERLLMEISAVAERIFPKEGPAPKQSLTILAALIVRVILCKMTILVYQTSLVEPYDESMVLSQERKDRLLVSAIEIFEYGHILLNDERLRQWRWAAHVFMQWQAAAYLLLAISTVPWSPVSERGWSALRHIFSSVAAAAEIDRMSDNAAVWLPFKTLYARAKRHRDAEVARLRSDHAAAGEMDREWSSKASNLGTMSSRFKTKMALDRWRQLVRLPNPEPRVGSQPQLAQDRQNPQQTNSFCDHVVPPAPPPTEPVGASTAKSTAAAPASQPLDPNMMEFMNEVMSQPTFASEDIWPLAFPNQSIPAVNTALAFEFAPGVGMDFRGSAPQSQPTMAVEAPLANTASRKGDTPQWTWSAAGLPMMTNPSGEMIDFATMNTVTDERFEGITSLDDYDINMDDQDFNWQTFSASMRDFVAPGWGQMS